MSNRELSKISVMRTLVKREFQEHRALFVYLPLVIALLSAVVFIVSMVRSAGKNEFWEEFHMGSLAQAKVPSMMEFAALRESERNLAMEIMYSFTLPAFLVSFWSTMLYYFLMTLYKQRQDRSILFWNSMPVSDAQTIVSKLLAGMIGCQAIYLGCLFLLQVSILLGTLVYGSFYGIDVWQTFVVPSHIVARFFTLLVYLVMALAWSLPVYAWLLFASAWSGSKLFAWAAGPWAIVTGIEIVFTKQYEIAATLLKHAMPVMFVERSQIGLAGGLEKFPGLELALSAAVGLALVYAAIRCNRSEDS